MINKVLQFRGFRSMRFRSVALSVLLFLVAPAYALAAFCTAPATVVRDSEETLFSIGLRFSFSDLVPEVVGAVRNTTTDKDSDVTGIQGDISIPLTGEFQGQLKVRVLGLIGNRDALGQAGLGFNFGSGQPMISGGVQGTNVEGGVNVELNGEFDPYVGVNLFGRPDGPDIVIVPPTMM